MKTLKSTTLIFILLFCYTNSNAQVKKPTCGVLNINQVGVYNYSSEVLGNITRREFSKLGFYEILYAEDIRPFLAEIDTNNLRYKNNSFNCYSKLCLVKSGEKIKADKMLSGQIEQMKDAIIISYRVIDVKSQNIEYSITKEFLNLNDLLKNMMVITLREMLGLENDEEIEELLIKKNSAEKATLTTKVLIV